MSIVFCAGDNGSVQDVLSMVTSSSLPIAGAFICVCALVGPGGQNRNLNDCQALSTGLHPFEFRIASLRSVRHTPAGFESTWVEHEGTHGEQ